MSKGTQHIMIMLAGMMDRDDVVLALQEAIDQYKNNSNNQQWNQLMAVCYLAMLSDDHVRGGEDPISSSLKMINEMEEIESAMKLIKPGKQ